MTEQSGIIGYLVARIRAIPQHPDIPVNAWLDVREEVENILLSAPAEPPGDYCPSCHADTQHGYKPAVGRCDRCGHTTPPAAEADPRMAAIAYGQSDEHRERFLREKQPPSPAEPPADDWCKCPIKTKGEITLTYHPIGGHAAPLLDGFRCQHCNRRVEAFHKAAPAAKVCEWELWRLAYGGTQYRTSCGHAPVVGGSADETPCTCRMCKRPVRIKPLAGEETSDV